MLGTIMRTIRKPLKLYPQERQVSRLVIYNKENDAAKARITILTPTLDGRKSHAKSATSRNAPSITWLPKALSPLSSSAPSQHRP